MNIYTYISIYIYYRESASRYRAHVLTHSRTFSMETVSIDSPVRTLTHSHIHAPTHSRTHALTHSRTHALTSSRAHALTRFLDRFYRISTWVRKLVGATPSQSFKSQISALSQISAHTRAYQQANVCLKSQRIIQLAIENQVYGVATISRLLKI